MSKITLKGNEINTYAPLPKVGDKAPDFRLIDKDLKEVSLKDFANKTLLISIVPSLDTDVCAASAKKFNEQATQLKNTEILVISKDLPFAQKRFCELMKIDHVHTLSDMRGTSFGKDWGVSITDGPLEGLFARAIIILDPNGKVIYTELVDEITKEPDYDQALLAL